MKAAWSSTPQYPEADFRLPNIDVRRRNSVSPDRACLALDIDFRDVVRRSGIKQNATRSWIKGRGSRCREVRLVCNQINTIANLSPDEWF